MCRDLYPFLDNALKIQNKFPAIPGKQVSRSLPFYTELSARHLVVVCKTMESSFGEFERPF